MYVNENLEIRNVTMYSNENETLQLAACTIKAYKRVILMITVYNAEGNLDGFKHTLDDILSKFSFKVMTILAGDINIDILKHTRLSSEYLSYTGSHGFVPLINGVARSARTGSCIDHILARNHENVLNSLHGVINLLTPDHHPIFSAFTGWGHATAIDYPAKSSEKFRSFSKRNHSAFVTQVSNVPWSRILEHEDAQTNFSAYVSKVNEIYNKSFPLCSRLPAKEHKLPADDWLNNELLQLRNVKGHLANKVKRFRDGSRPEKAARTF